MLVSALTGAGCSALMDRVSETLSSSRTVYAITLDMADGASLACVVIGATAAGAAEVHLADDSLLGSGSPPPAHRRAVLFVHGHNPTDDDADFAYIQAKLTF